MSLSIRPPVLAERPAMLAIYNYEVEHGTAIFDIIPKAPAAWEKWCDRHNIGNHLLLAAVDNRSGSEKVVGFAALSPYREKDAYAATVELSIFVAPEQRRQGVGRALLKAVIASAHVRSDIHTIISVITADNTASRRLHENCGFKYCGTIAEAGYKAGALHDITHYQLLIR